MHLDNIRRYGVRGLLALSLLALGGPSTTAAQPEGGTSGTTDTRDDDSGKWGWLGLLGLAGLLGLRRRNDRDDAVRARV